MSDVIVIGNTEPLEAQFTLLGVPSTTSIGRVFVRLVGAPDTYYNGSAYVATRTAIAMSEVGDTLAAGFHRYNLVTTGMTAGHHVIETEDTTANSDNPKAPYTLQLITAQGADDANAAAVGKAVYDPITSILTVYKKDQPTVVHKQFDCKDVDGAAAGTNPIYQKLPI